MLPVTPEELKEYEIVFDKNVSINFVLSYDQFPEDEVLDLKTLRCRVMTKKNTMNENIEVRIEFTKYEDISFVMESIISITDYAAIQEKYELRIDFDGFIKAMCTFFDQTVTDPENLRIYIYNPESDHPSLTFFQALHIRIVEVFTITMGKPSEDYVLKLAQCRFNAIKKELEEKTNDLTTALNKLDARNPSLCLNVRNMIEKVE